MKILLINGPNLNLLGIREKSIYGNSTFESYFRILEEKYSSISLEYYQSNIEGELINKIHETGFSYDGLVINAGAYTHTSVAIRDAISGIKAPVVEVHISNILTRESFRHESLIGPVCIGSIMGFGLDSYRLGIEAITEYIKS
ncbi:MAG: type II 3-dehydroquinate dehydratase [Bacteroidota bacterium]|nr:type II 3-dehydroquinate dehydratase [Bacteroidota bacterium]MDP3431689.1 type II 3-dehydroquinate dehydratase [Bacteroidota bacterium]